MQNGTDKLSRARQVLAGMETAWRGDGRAAGWTIPFSIAAINRNLSTGGITAPSLHEVHGGAGNGAASGFALWLAGLALARVTGPVFWIKSARGGDTDALYPPALNPQIRDKLIITETQQRRDVLWAFEEILVSGQAACVIAEVPEMDMTAARRLQLASERGHGLAIALCRSGYRSGAGAGVGPKTNNSVARTRWRVGTCQEGWKLELIGGRGVRPGEWRVKHDATALSLHLVSAPSDRPLPTNQPKYQHAAA